MNLITAGDKTFYIIVGFGMRSRDRDFYFGISRKIPKNTEKNPENSKISGIGILKPLKNPEKIPSSKLRKSRASGLGFENPEKIPKKSRVKNPENPKIPGN